ncbi:RING finger protein 11b isoform X1 [Lepisosteus oculatus]|uniref:RING finger protein 11b isoform X1 n=1 Tax=Lepisosteus oculatus TaxID=7918 RepID=UPI00073FF789|nr:PREDICTED: RING finger protein 11 isoform X1 [Lepisosteus oculatus]
MGNCLKSPTSDDISLLHESQSDRASYGDGTDPDQEPPPPYQEQAQVPVYHPTPSQTRLATQLTEEEQVRIAQRIGLIQHLPKGVYDAGRDGSEKKIRESFETGAFGEDPELARGSSMLKGSLMRMRDQRRPKMADWESEGCWKEAHQAPHIQTEIRNWGIKILQINPPPLPSSTECRSGMQCKTLPDVCICLCISVHAYAQRLFRNKLLPWIPGLLRCIF